MILDVAGVHSYYGKSHILQGVSFQIGDGELVTLLGRNGAGKSTTLKTVAGVVTPKAGSITFMGKPVAGQPAHRIAARGVCFVPEHRGIFKLLTVEENLKLGARRDSPWQLADIYRIFPRLQERRKNGGAQLSGGEQQMLAVGRILRTGANLLLLDEISEGLAPVIVQALARMILTLKKKGYTVVMVEQNFRFAAPLADRFYVMEHGTIVERFAANELQAKMPVLNELLGV